MSPKHGTPNRCSLSEIPPSLPAGPPPSGHGACQHRHRIQQMPHVATVQLPVDGIRGRDMAEEVPIGVFRTLRLQAVLTGHVLNQEAGGPVFQRVAFVVSQYLFQFRSVRTRLAQGGFQTGGSCAGAAEKI